MVPMLGGSGTSMIVSSSIYLEAFFQNVLFKRVFVDTLGQIFHGVLVGRGCFEYLRNFLPEKLLGKIHLEVIYVYMPSSVTAYTLLMTSFFIRHS